jgi:hypothetical protein
MIQPQYNREVIPQQGSEISDPPIHQQTGNRGEPKSKNKGKLSSIMDTSHHPYQEKYT